MKVKQSIQQSILRHSYKLPMERQSLIDQKLSSTTNHKYQPAAQLTLKCLPPRYHFQCVYGEMTLHFSNLLFSDGISKKRSLIYQCQMLGYSNKQCPFIKDQITYTIHTSNKMFKQYLKDMNTCVIGIYDSRNYEPIGHFYLNFLMYMKSIQDNVVQKCISTNNSRCGEIKNEHENNQRYYLPFIDQKCQIILPVYDYRNKKNIQTNNKNQQNFGEILKTTKNSLKQRIIGQITLKFSARVYQNPISLGYTQIQEQTQNKLKARNSKISSNNEEYELNLSKIKQYQRKSLLSPNNYMTNNNSRNISNKNMIRQSKLMDKQQNLQSVNINSGAQISSLIGQNDVNQTQNKYSNFQKGTPKPSFLNYNREQINDKNKMFGLNENANRKSYFKQNMKLSQFPVCNEIQLMQLKLQAQQLFSYQNKSNQSQNKNQFRQEAKTIIQVIKVKSKLIIPYLDIFISNKIQDGEKTHLKIYKHQGSYQKTKNQQYFYNKIMIQGKCQKRIEIVLPNSQGKCQFNSNDISSNGSQMCIFNKGSIIGFLILKRHKIHNNQAIQQNQAQTKKQKQSNSFSKVALVYVSKFDQQLFKKFKSNFQLSLSIKNIEICTMNNQKYAHDTYKIVDNSQIPNTFSFQLKNKHEQIIGISQNIISKPKQINLSEANLMPYLILDKMHSIKMISKIQNIQKMSFRAMYYVGTISQISYLLQKLQTQIENNCSKNKYVMPHNVQQTYSQFNKRQQKYEVQQNKNEFNQSKLYNKSQFNQQDHQNKSQLNQQLQNFNNNNEDKHLNNNNPDKTKIVINKNSIQQQSQNQKSLQKNRFHTQQQLYQQEDGKQKMIDQLQDQFHQQVEQAEISHTYLVQFFINSFFKIIKQSTKKQQNLQVKLQQYKSKQIVNQVSFVKLIQNLMSFQKVEELQDQLQLMKAIFIDTVVTQQMNSRSYNLKQFIGCLSAFYNFFNLFTTIKQQIIKQLLQKQPNAVQKLQNYIYLRIVTQSELFSKILSKIPLNIQEKINKLYRFGSSDPISIKFLLQELNNFNNRERKGVNNKFIYNFKDLKNNKSSLQSEDNGIQAQKNQIHSLASDLGRLIRETIEDVLISKLKQENIELIIKSLKQLIDFTTDNEHQKRSISNISQREINIKQFKQFMENQQIQITIWQSLMIIEQIKGWFYVDFNLDEGIISFNTIVDWLKSLNKKGLFNVKQQKKQRIQDQSQSIKNISTKRNQVIQDANKKKSLIQKDYQKQIYKNKEPSKNVQIYSQNASNLNLNNESDIANIANLLKEQHNNLYNPSMSELPRQNKERTQIKQMQNILKNLQNNEKQLQQISVQKSLYSEEQNLNNQFNNQSLNDPFNNEPLNDKSMEQRFQICLNVKLRQFKLKQNFKTQLQNKKEIKKLNLKFIQKQPAFQTESMQEYFYLKQKDLQTINTQDISKKYQINQIIDVKQLKSFQNNIKSLSLSLYSIRNSMRIDESNQDLLLTGNLPIQQITSFIQNNKRLFQIEETKSNKILKSKTMVLYNAKKHIVGKALIQISLSNKIQNKQFLNSIIDNQYSFNFSLQVKNRNILKTKIGSNNNFNRDSLFQPIFSVFYFQEKHPNQVISLKKQIIENNKYQINLPEPLLEYRLLIKLKNQIFDESVQNNNQSSEFQCTISLEQLFFRKIINKNQYPLINRTTGQFICALLVSLSPKIKENLSQQNVSQQLIIQQNMEKQNLRSLNKQQIHKMEYQISQKYVFIPISLFSICIKTEKDSKKVLPKRLIGNLYLKKITFLKNVQILFKSQIIQMKLDQEYFDQTIYESLQQIDGFYIFQIPFQQNSKYFIQFIYEGRKISQSKKYSFENLTKNKQSICLNICQSNYFGIQMRFKYNIIKYQKTNFRLNNVFKALKSILNQKNINKISVIDETLLKNQKNQKKLTFTQYQILQNIVKNNKIHQIQQGKILISKKFNNDKQKLNYFNQLIREFVYKQESYNQGQIFGRLEKNQLVQILNHFEIQFNQDHISQDYIQLLEYVFINLKLFNIGLQKDEINKQENKFYKPAYNSVNQLYQSLKAKYK